MIFGLLYVITDNSALLLASFWLLISGFFAYLIIAHLYKIVPFLVWFEKFSPLVGKEKVPMLTDMVDEKSANFQFNFAVIALFLSTIAILLKSNQIFSIALCFLSISAIFLVKNVIYIIRFK